VDRRQITAEFGNVDVVVELDADVAVDIVAVAVVCLDDEP